MKLSTTKTPNAAAKFGAGCAEFPSNGSLLTPQQTAALLNTSVATLVRKTRAGEIVAIRLGYRTVRYSRDDVVEYIDRLRSAVSGIAKELGSQTGTGGVR